MWCPRSLACSPARPACTVWRSRAPSLYLSLSFSVSLSLSAMDSRAEHRRSLFQLQPPSPPHPLHLTPIAPSPRAFGAAGNVATSRVATAAAGTHGLEAVVRCWPGRDLARVRPDAAKHQHGFPGAPSPLHRRRRAASVRNRKLPDDLPTMIRFRDLVLKFEEREGPNCIVCDSYE